MHNSSIQRASKHKYFSPHLAQQQHLHPVRWEMIDNYVIDTVLGTFMTSVTRLAPESCRYLGIDEQQLVLLPMEGRHARLRQVPEFCHKVLLQRLLMSLPQVQYLMELLEIQEDDVLRDAGITGEDWFQLIEKNEASEEASLILADYFTEVLETLNQAEQPSYH